MQNSRTSARKNLLHILKLHKTFTKEHSVSGLSHSTWIISITIIDRTRFQWTCSTKILKITLSFCLMYHANKPYYYMSLIWTWAFRNEFFNDRNNTFEKSISKEFRKWREWFLTLKLTLTSWYSEIRMNTSWIYLCEFVAVFLITGLGYWASLIVIFTYFSYRANTKDKMPWNVCEFRNTLTLVEYHKMR